MSFKKKDTAKRLSEIIDEIDSGHEVSLIVLLNSITKAYNEAVGTYLAKNSTIIAYENGILFLRAESSSIRSELLLRKHQIIQVVNESLSSKKIDDIKFK